MRAGLDVFGVDLVRHTGYPGNMGSYCMNVADLRPDRIRHIADFVWASPPCQRFTAYRRRPGHVGEVPNIIPQTRDLLRATGLPYVIENVPGAPLESPFTLCGSMFGLNVRRHRIFETNFPVTPPACQHDWQEPRFPGATNRKNKRKTVEVGVWRIPLSIQQAAMGINWMTRKQLSQAIPPAYSEFIARQWLTQRLLAA